MNKLTTSMFATLMLGASLSAVADDSMKGMDMSKMPMMDKTSNSTAKGSQSMPADCMHTMDMDKMSMKSSKGDQVACGVGVITSIDATKDMVVLNHQAIKALNWPAMKMGFKVADHKLLDGLKAGQKVCFELTTEGGEEIVTGIMPTK